jgi:hypothetical protein
MANKLGRKEFPIGFNVGDFQYQGRPAKDQDDFGSDVGISDMACVDQFGDSNKAKYYHVGVVQAKTKWFVYLEWGRVFSGRSWNPSFAGQDFQFIPCDSEKMARNEFQKKCREKNIKRLEKKSIAGKEIWVGKNGKDGYIVQSLATRERGLPDAYLIKDSSGLEEVVAKPKKKISKSSAANNFQPQVIELAKSLAGGTMKYARDASAATGVVPTIESIIKVRDDLLGAAMSRLSKIGNDHKKQVKDKDLIDISNLVAALVPRPIPRYASKEVRENAVILSSENILQIQQDLDTFESSLKNEDLFEEVEQNVVGIDPNQVLGADILWIDPSTVKGKWLKSTFESMSNNRHGYISQKLQIKNIFEVSRPKFDNLFIKEVKDVAKKNDKKRYSNLAILQPNIRNDISDISDYAKSANVFFGIHGTRAVNVQPILSTNLRLPKHLAGKGVVITGAAFGPGIYFATDWKKAYGYTGHGSAIYGGGGSVANRGFFMFLNDVIMGDAHFAKESYCWNEPPDNKDSIVAVGGKTRKFGGHLENDEHIIFNQNYQRIRYIVEGELK